MSPAELIADLPDSHPCYIPGVGEVTIGEVRRTEESPALADEREATLEMWARRATDRYRLEPWENTGAGQPEGRA